MTLRLLFVSLIPTVEAVKNRVSYKVIGSYEHKWRFKRGSRIASCRGITVIMTAIRVLIKMFKRKQLYNYELIGYEIPEY